MNAGIDVLKAQIRSKKAALAKLREREEEFKRLQKVMAGIPKLQADLSALERSLAILKGEEVPEDPRDRKVIDIATIEHLFTRNVPRLVYRVLKEAAKPLRIEQIMPLLAAMGCTAVKPTVRGAIYRNAKPGKIFKVLGPGIFALSEWYPEVPDEPKKSS